MAFSRLGQIAIAVVMRPSWAPVWVRWEPASSLLFPHPSASPRFSCSDSAWSGWAIVSGLPPPPSSRPDFGGAIRDRAP